MCVEWGNQARSEQDRGSTMYVHVTNIEMWCQSYIDGTSKYDEF